MDQNPNNNDLARDQGNFVQLSSLSQLFDGSIVNSSRQNYPRKSLLARSYSPPRPRSVTKATQTTMVNEEPRRPSELSVQSASSNV